MYIINRVHSATAEGADEGAVFGESFCGSLGFGPFQKGGLLTPCFNDMVLITAAHAWIILGENTFCARFKEHKRGSPN